MSDILFYAMVAALFTHELDAVKRHEWRVLPLLRSLPDRQGEQAFIWLHVPLFAVLLIATSQGEDGAMRIALAIFAVVHVWLHWIYRRHPAYEFNTRSSWALIILTGALGVVYLLAVVGAFAPSVQGDLVGADQPENIARLFVQQV